MKVGYCIIHISVFTCIYPFDSILSASSDFDVSTIWDAYLCSDEIRMVDENTIIVTGDGHKDVYLPCIALRKNIKVVDEYQISTQLINTGAPNGERNFGLAFNADDIKNYDFAYLR